MHGQIASPNYLSGQIYWAACVQLNSCTQKKEKYVWASLLGLTVQMVPQLTVRPATDFVPFVSDCLFMRNWHEKRIQPEVFG